MVRFTTSGSLQSVSNVIADVTSSLTTLIIDNISSHSMLLDNYVVLHAAIVSSLHKLIGVEFGEPRRPLYIL